MIAITMIAQPPMAAIRQNFCLRKNSAIAMNIGRNIA